MRRVDNFSTRILHLLPPAYPPPHTHTKGFAGVGVGWLVGKEIDARDENAFKYPPVSMSQPGRTENAGKCARHIRFSGPCGAASFATRTHTKPPA